VLRSGRRRVAAERPARRRWRLYVGVGVGVGGIAGAVAGPYLVAILVLSGAVEILATVDRDPDRRTPG
jgi:hypothetical protein